MSACAARDSTLQGGFLTYDFESRAFKVSGRLPAGSSGTLMLAFGLIRGSQFSFFGFLGLFCMYREKSGSAQQALQKPAQAPGKGLEAFYRVLRDAA